ncbi:YihY/virulence factor BrkB family protein [Halegenticoccus tardaugens]|uniref:YihY/virulence factor BrkB family protein n=1 Tax=Halegenticoccus tardaugens TaxID=2071624 RepID=UPI00100B6BC5|nr:YihY/virulence factor BrkB family protein [Halegenticoccus tardaugens]
MSATVANRSAVVDTAKAVVREVQEREVTFLAASISYYAFISLIPLLVLAFVVALFVGGESLQREIATLAGRYLLPEGEQLVRSAVDNQTGQGSVGLVSFLLTTWGALKLFRGVDTAFSRVYGSDTGGIADQVKDGLLVITSIAVGVLGVFVVSAAISLVEVPFIGVVSSLLLLATLIAAFFPLYYVFPDVDVTPREVLPGTVFTAVGWAVLAGLFGVYADLAGGSVAGALGAVLLLLTWFYFGGTLLLVGAVINAVSGDRLADRQLQQGPGRRDSLTEMSEESEGATERDRDVEPTGAPDINELERRVEELRADFAAFETDVDARTVKKPELESELKRYVRSRMRRGKARGWGPYLVLLYGTVMTLGAFFYLDGVYAIAAMIVLFLSTLGLYVLFVLVGLGLNLLDVPGRAVDAVRDRRS